MIGSCFLSWFVDQQGSEPWNADTPSDRGSIQDYRIPTLGGLFLSLLALPVKMWQQILGHIGALEQFVPKGRAKTLSPSACSVVAIQEVV